MERKKSKIGGLWRLLLIASLVAGALGSDGAYAREMRKSEDVSVECLSFDQIWTIYLGVQAEYYGPDDDVPIGKVVDFAQYNSEEGAPPSFDRSDPDFNQEFHGHVEGFKEVLTFAGWFYCPIESSH